MRQTAAIVLAAFFALLLQAEPSVTPASSFSEDQDKPTAKELRKGKRVFRVNCQTCHGQDGQHPDELFSLADDKWKNGDTLEDIVAAVTDGIPGTAMLGFQGRLSEEDILVVSKYVYSFRFNED